MDCCATPPPSSQALFATAEFRNTLLSAARAPPSAAAPALFHLRHLFVSLALSLRPAIAPRALQSQLPFPFRGAGQQDASEFLRVLLHTISVTGMDESGEGKALGKQVRQRACLCVCRA